MRSKSGDFDRSATAGLSSSAKGAALRGDSALPDKPAVAPARLPLAGTVACSRTSVSIPRLREDMPPRQLITHDD